MLMVKGGSDMDQVKVGKFISECRRKQNLTQLELAQKLNITDRAISKWENGRGLPDSSLMLELCNILQISVNDLLSGEVILMENYNKELENNLLEMIKQKEQSDKRLLVIEWVVAVLSLIILFIPILFGALVPIDDWQKIVIVFSGFVPAIVGFCFALKIEQVAGYYECAECGHKYVPTYKAVSFAPHVGRTRKMKCPNCGKKSWQKKL